MLSFFSVATLLVAIASAEVTPMWVGRFTAPGAVASPWAMVKLKGEKPTSYRVAIVAGRTALEARVDDSMSLMARPISVDLAQRPVLCWRWYVDGPVQNADMTRRSGDDYAARVYIAFDMPDSELSGSTRFKLKIARSMFGRSIPDAALVYVWDNSHPVGTARRSSYTDRSQLVVADSGAGKARTWVSKRADVASDFARAFGNKPGTPVQIAVASDGDNTNSKGRAAFADIHFVARGQPCAF
jgi:Protein of unknown function (DUF3047)